MTLTLKVTGNGLKVDSNQKVLENVLLIDVKVIIQDFFIANEQIPSACISSLV